jgi:hypothetical protein
VKNEDESFVGNLQEVFKLFSESMGKISSEPSSSIIISVKVKQQIKDKMKSSTLCMIDLDPEHFNQLENMISGGESNILSKAVNLKKGLYVVIGNCSPHVSMIKETKNTMDFVHRMKFVKQVSSFIKC